MECIILKKNYQDPIDHIPDAWKTSKLFPMSNADQHWIREALFVDKNKLKDDAPVTLWWYPPPIKPSLLKKPQFDAYFTHRLFLWMPRRTWKVDFKCPTCVSGYLS